MNSHQGAYIAGISFVYFRIVIYTAEDTMGQFNDRDKGTTTKGKVSLDLLCLGPDLLLLLVYKIIVRPGRFSLDDALLFTCIHSPPSFFSTSPPFLACNVLTLLLLLLLFLACNVLAFPYQGP